MVKTSMYFQVSLTNSGFSSILHMQPIISSASFERGESQLSGGANNFLECFQI